MITDLLMTINEWMAGGVGPWWTIIVGVILMWVALDMLGGKACSMSSSLMARLRVKGLGGAFLPGLAYFLSGSCTFGFIAPIPAIITVQQKIAIGILFILLFGIGHCILIVVAGSSAALVRRVLENIRFQQGGMWLRRIAGVAIACLGGYFIVQPFVGGA